MGQFFFTYRSGYSQISIILSSKKMEHSVAIKNIERINHNVLRILTDKPLNYNFNPGQATELSVAKDGLKDEKRPFTFTSLPEDHELEFIIKIYPSHNGVTEQIVELNIGNQLIIGDAWDTLEYEGPGTFIAGGTGITPFIAIIKKLMDNGTLEDNRLFFGNKQQKDIIYKENLEAWLGDNLKIVLSEECTPPYDNGYMDKNFFTRHNLNISRPVYLCGPPKMMDSVKAILFEMGLPKSLLIT